jgi:hypothetical protein
MCARWTIDEPVHRVVVFNPTCPEAYAREKRLGICREKLATWQGKSDSCSVTIESHLILIMALLDIFVTRPKASPKHYRDCCAALFSTSQAPYEHHQILCKDG